MRKSGIIIRASGGFFDVAADDQQIRCRARGRVHLDGNKLLPGDYVFWEEDPHHDGFGILTGVKERKNTFIRPNVANLDQLIMVASLARPATDSFLIDQMSAVAVKAGCEFVLCLNKNDLEDAGILRDRYCACGFQVLCTSAVTGEGIEELRQILNNKISAFTGNSGVGKTSLINMLLPDYQLKTAPVSTKHARGKHTTRRTELFPVPSGGFLADTPGFAALEFTMLTEVKPLELASCFPEFPAGQCRFPDCLHVREPSCAVQNAVKNSEIPIERYQSYLRLLNMIRKE